MRAGAPPLEPPLTTSVETLRFVYTERQHQRCDIGSTCFCEISTSRADICGPIGGLGGLP